MRRIARTRPHGRTQELRFEVVGKRGGGTRTLTHLGDRAQRSYRAAVARVVPAVELALGPGVIANRARPTVSGFELDAWTPARRRYARSIATTSAGPWRAAFLGDVQDCYASITPATVEQTLRRLDAPPDAVRAIVALLLRFEAEGVRGLPIGPEPSALLANAVLHPVDRALVEAVVAPTFRWVDDVVTFATDVATARKAADVFERSLGRLGLAANPRKCRIVDDPAAVLPVASEPSGVIDLGVA